MASPRRPRPIFDWGAIPYWDGGEILPGWHPEVDIHPVVADWLRERAQAATARAEQTFDPCKPKPRSHSAWPAGFTTLTALVLTSISINAMLLGIIGENLGRMYRQGEEIHSPS